MLADQLILFNPEWRDNLLPLTYTRPVADIRIGISKLSEQWARLCALEPAYITQDYLSQFPYKEGHANLLINGGLIPDDYMVAAVMKLELGQALIHEGHLLAALVDPAQLESFDTEDPSSLEEIPYDTEPHLVQWAWDIFRLNGFALNLEFKRITEGKTSLPLNETNTHIGEGEIFIEEGAVVNCAILNTSEGPIYIGKDAEIMEGSIIRGPFAAGEHSVVKIGAKIYGPTTIGAHAKVGGEINNCVIFSYSNKGHDGFLGNSVIGEWCNLGADTNTSNLKNNYADVKLWDYVKGGFVNTGLQFCGLIMGDHSKSGINTMFNTGTVVGVSANIFGSGFPRNFIPSFSWGGASGFTTFKIPKAFEVAERMMGRRNIELTEADKKMIQQIFDDSAVYRVWDKEA